MVSSARSAEGREPLAYEGAYARADGGLSVAAGLGPRDLDAFARSFEFGGAGGYRFGNWSLFGLGEANFWRSATLDDSEEIVMVVNLGVGADLLSAEGLVRSAIAFGPSILTVPTNIDEAGEVGFFVDVRPVGLRWAVADAYVLGLDPLYLSVNVPIPGGIPLVEIQFRTSVTLERRF